MLWLAYLLAAVAGIVEVAGFIALGGIFTAHVSGDTVLAAVALVHGSWTDLWQHLAPVPLIVVGYLMGGTLVKLSVQRGLPYWFTIGAGLEAVFLGLFAVGHTSLAHGSLTFVPRGRDLVALMACLSFAMGTQNVLVRNVDRIDVRTTFVTGMVVGFAHELLDWIFDRLGRSRVQSERRQAAAHAAIWLAFFAGGCAGGFLQVVRGASVFYIPCVAMALLAAYGWLRPVPRVRPES
jgi:uncharacterized membrane protein YoaK (UPF0700 family)